MPPEPPDALSEPRPAADTTRTRSDADISVPPATPYSPSEHRALAVSAVLALAAMIWVARPLGIGLLLGMLSAFAMQPLYQRIRAHTPPRPDIAAMICTLAAAVGFFSTVGVFADVLIRRGVTAAAALPTLFGPKGAARTATVWLAERLRPLHIRPEDINARLTELAGEAASRLTSIAGALAGAMFSAMLTLFFVLVTLHFTLRRWTTLVHQLEKMSPLHPRHSHALLEEFRIVGRTALLGTAATGIVQGVLGAFGYWITGMPEVALLGMATAVASLVPVVGTLVVWIPASIYLIASGHPGTGIALFAYGSAVVVGFADYMIRPRLVGAHESTPTLVTFVALFGGIEVFGVVGLILGPLIMALAMSVLRIYAREVSLRRNV